jgi:hypothetical protein
MSAVSAHVRPLLGLRQGQENMRCVHADQHASSPGLVRYSLRQLSPHLQLKQTKAWEPFLENALCWYALVTTEAQLTTEDLDVVGGMRNMILLLSGRYTRTTSLRLYDTALQASRVVNDTEGRSTSWVSVFRV